MALAPGQLDAMLNMFKDPDADSDSDLDDQPSKGTSAALNPGSIGPAQGSVDNSTEESAKNSKDIWVEDEVPEGAEFDSVYDPRPQPDYDIVYSQSVTSEDIFLQMGNKTPMTASCENMTVKIKLPDTKMADVELDVKSKFLDCRTPRYKLGLHLPHPVNPKLGGAKFDAKNETLIVTLKMSREYDMFNF